MLEDASVYWSPCSVKIRSLNSLAARLSFQSSCRLKGLQWYEYFLLFRHFWADHCLITSPRIIRQAGNSLRAHRLDKRCLHNTKQPVERHILSACGMLLREREPAGFGHELPLQNGKAWKHFIGPIIQQPGFSQAWDKQLVGHRW